VDISAVSGVFLLEFAPYYGKRWENEYHFRNKPSFALPMFALKQKNVDLCLFM
jgi:hypothetical protein